MNQIYTISFNKESDHSAFLFWLCAYEQENKIDANARIRSIRCWDTFAKWNIAPPFAHVEAILNASLAFNATISP